MKKPDINFIVLLFSVIIFISGFLVLLNGNIMIKDVGINEIQLFDHINKEGFDAPGSAQPENKCPNLLVKRDGKILLYNNNQPKKQGENPMEFKDLNEYSVYLDKQSKLGVVCPVLFLQKEYDAQNNDVYRIRQSPFYIEGGLPALPIQIHDNSIPVETPDATRDNGYNLGTYPGFDPYNINNGRYSDLDVIHDSTEKRQGGSVNPADPNWLGVIATQQAVDTGIYKENEINKAIYPKLPVSTQ